MCLFLLILFLWQSAQVFFSLFAAIGMLGGVRFTPPPVSAVCVACVLSLMVKSSIHFLSGVVIDTRMLHARMSHVYVFVFCVLSFCVCGFSPVPKCLFPLSVGGGLLGGANNRRFVRLIAVHARSRPDGSPSQRCII